MSTSDIPIGPSDGEPTTFPVTTGSVHFDLTGAAYVALARAIRMHRPLTLKGNVDVFYRWSAQKSGGTVDETMLATGGTPANQCDALFTGERSDERAPIGTKGIIIKGSGAGFLRIRASG